MIQASRVTLTAGILLAVLAGCGRGGRQLSGRSVVARRGDVVEVVQATGEVDPLNKVSIIPPVTGRIDRIVMDEGDRVRKGQVLAWMSSSDRAAILDNARSEGEAVLKRWQAEYRSTPIVAPTDGVIIARNVVAGQTVDGNTDMYDLSDRLVVYASVDETDLAKIHMGQQADCTVEAYPDRPFSTRVVLIGHQAVKVNNVVSYQVTLEPGKTPGELRAGMTANVNFVVQRKADVVWIPSYAVKGQSQGPAMVSVVVPGAGPPRPRDIVLGITDGVKVEVISGLKAGESVWIPGLNLPQSANGGPMALHLGGNGHGH